MTEALTMCDSNIINSNGNDNNSIMCMCNV